jgi:hypothetical protein
MTSDAWPPLRHHASPGAPDSLRHHAGGPGSGFSAAPWGSSWSSSSRLWRCLAPAACHAWAVQAAVVGLSPARRRSVRSLLGTSRCTARWAAVMTLTGRCSPRSVRRSPGTAATRSPQQRGVSASCSCAVPSPPGRSRRTATATLTSSLRAASTSPTASPVPPTDSRRSKVRRRSAAPTPITGRPPAATTAPALTPTPTTPTKSCTAPSNTASKALELPRRPTPRPVPLIVGPSARCSTSETRSPLAPRARCRTLCRAGGSTPMRYRSPDSSRCHAA